MELIRIIEEKYKKTPNKVIIETEDKKITYKDLNELTNGLAKFLNEMFKDKHVPFISSKDEDYIVCMIACWKAGKIYIPINYDSNEFQIQKLLSNLKCDRILVRNKRVDNIKCVEYKENYLSNYECNEFSEIAYILSTSGTTGNPKLIKVTHENINWFCKTMNELIPFQKNDYFILSTPPQFDVSFHEMLSFIYGDGTLVTINELNPLNKLKKLGEILSDKAITHLALSPTSLEFLIKTSKNYLKESNLKYLMIAGEKFKISTLENWKSLNIKSNVYNLYGPTESTVYATYHQIDMEHRYEDIPIGQALKGQIIKLMKNHQIDDKSGEILIGGEGVSKGYYNNNEQTKEKFIKIDGVPFYKSGDLGEYENGDLFYKGRIDDQIKINGIRLEIGEIEDSITQILNNEYEIRIVYNKKKILAFYTGKQVISSKIKQKVYETLPRHMVPNDYFKVDDFPLNRNRKLDKQKLINIYEESNINDQNLEINSFEEEVITKIEGVLETKLNLKTDLFKEHEMDSLTQVEVLISLEELISHELDLTFLRRNNTPEKIAKELVNYDNQTEKISIDNVCTLDEVYDNYLANTFLLKRGEYTSYDTFYIQKCYHFEKFKQILNHEFLLPLKTTPNNIEDAINSLINSNQVLRTIFSKKKEQLFANVYNNECKFRLKIISNDLSKSEKDNLQSLINAEDVGYLPWYVYYVESENKLVFFIDHLIIDKSSIDVLTNKIYSILNKNDTQESSIDYWDAVNKLENISNTESKVINTVLAKGFNKVTKNPLKKLYMEKPFKYFKIPLENMHDIQEIILFGNYAISKILLESQNISDISGATILNIRDIVGLNLNNVLGDIHSTVPLYYNTNFDIDTFNDINKSTIDLFEKGINLNSIMYSKFPEIPKELKEHELYLDDNTKFNSNFLGALNPREVDETLELLLKEAEKLSVFSTTKLYISFFKVKNYLIFIPLSQGLISPNIVLNNGGIICE